MIHRHPRLFLFFVVTSFFNTFAAPLTVANPRPERFNPFGPNRSYAVGGPAAVAKQRRSVEQTRAMAQMHAKRHVLANDLRVIHLDLPNELWVHYYRMRLEKQRITLITELPAIVHQQQYVAAYNLISFAAIDQQFGHRFIETLFDDSQPTHYVVYVIDASGSMLPDLELAVHNVLTSAERISPRTNVAIIFYQDGKAIQLKQRGYHRADKAWRDDVRAFVADRKIVPQGSSNPYTALEKAFWLEPNHIYWISNGLGLGRYEEDRQKLEARIKRSRESYKAPVHAIKLNSAEYQTTMQNITRMTGGTFRFIEDQRRGFSD